MLVKCRQCICQECKKQFGIDPMQCDLSDCKWCLNDNDYRGYRTCSGYIDKGGTYGRNAK